MFSLAHAITTTPAAHRISRITQSILHVSIPRYYGESTTASNLFGACLVFAARYGLRNR